MFNSQVLNLNGGTSFVIVGSVGGVDSAFGDLAAGRTPPVSSNSA